MLEAFVEMYMPLVKIILANPWDLIDMDFSQVGIDTWFIAQSYIKQGKFLVVKNDDLKRDLLKFCFEHPDRIWKGENKGEVKEDEMFKC